jgi:hypothetical protein
MGHTLDSSAGEIDSIEVLLPGPWELIREDDQNQVILLIREEPTL